MADNDSVDLTKELKSIRDDFNLLQQRLLSVEQKLTSPSQPSPGPIEPAKETGFLHVVMEDPPTPSPEQSVEPTFTPQNAPPAVTVPSIDNQQPVSKNTLETEIGQYWLNKLGVTSLVVGVIFLLLYSFQYCNAPIKLLIGSAIAASLVIFGEKIAKEETRRWYGFGLMGGGWALGYFIVYAMYYISDLKMISYYPIELALSLALCAGAMLRAMQCNAEVIAVLSASLADYSICVSGPSIESNVPIVLIAALVSIVSIRQKWYRLLVWITLLSYIGHLSASNMVYSVMQSVMADQGSLALIYLFSLWLIFHIATFFCDETQGEQRKSIIIATCVNACCFSLGLLFLSDRYFPDQKYLYIGGAGVLYLLSAPWLYRRNLRQLTTVSLLIGLSFVNLAGFIKISGTSLELLDLFQLALLAIVGLQYDIKAFRWFAMPLSLLFFPLWFFQDSSDSYSATLGLTSINFTVIGILAVATFASIFWLYGQQKYIEHYKSDLEGYRYLYYACANFAGCCTPYALRSRSWALPLWSIQAAANACLSIRNGKSFFWFTTVVLALFAGLNLLFTMAWLWVPTLIVVAVCYAVHGYCRQMEQANPPVTTQRVSAILGNLILTALLYTKLSTFWLSTGLALEGLLLLAAGLALRERVFRISGLLVLFLLTSKLLFVDLAQAGTLQRIISFIASGLVFLVASYGYSRFTEKFGINK